MSNPLDWVANFTLGLIGLNTSDISSWFAGIGGQVASGIEAGIVSIFKDLWDVVVGPVELFVGAVLILFALKFLFSNDLIQAGQMIGALSPS